jgi:hypothetical protein
MSKWGVFDGEGDKHVMPCDKRGYVLKPHLARKTCICKPKEKPPGIWVHNDPDLGGADS